MRLNGARDCIAHFGSSPNKSVMQSHQTADKPRRKIDGVCQQSGSTGVPRSKPFRVVGRRAQRGLGAPEARFIHKDTGVRSSFLTVLFLLLSPRRLPYKCGFQLPYRKHISVPRSANDLRHTEKFVCYA